MGELATWDGGRALVQPDVAGASREAALLTPGLAIRVFRLDAGEVMRWDGSRFMAPLSFGYTMVAKATVEEVTAHSVYGGSDELWLAYITASGKRVSVPLSSHFVLLEERCAASFIKRMGRHG